MNLSAVIVSFKSENLIDKVLNKLSRLKEVIIIENSQQRYFKKKIEKKYKNVRVIIPPKNLGYAKAFNIGYKICKSDYVLTLTPDVKFENNTIKNIINLIKSFKNFTLIAPEYKNQKIHKNFVSLKKQKKTKKIKKFLLEEVKEIDWCFCLLNKKKLKNKRILDENFFMYFETIDFCRKIYLNKQKMFVIKNLKFEHFGTSSTNKKYNFKILINRNWHFGWSKFYYYKKNFNYFYACKKLLPNIYQGIVGLLLSILKFSYKSVILSIYSLYGILCGIFFFKSYYRPNIE